ncbi:MAG: hypothetical protein LBS52_05690 [Dysgonamonadaceae bacterium]|jgi:hypothetical protein|nr:hypothetical protein [Dysgonamonadaceae bacterium]
MDSGTIIYLIVIVLFAILGSFNKAKKGQQEKNQGKPAIPEVERKPQEARTPREIKAKPQPLPVAEFPPKQRIFSPSVSTITSSIEGLSSLKGTLYVDDTPVEGDIVGGHSAAAKGKDFPHPLIADLTGDGSQHELRKAVLYAEILNRRY